MINQKNFLNQKEAQKTQKKPSVVMLTADRRIDRRILLQADSLEKAGWKVTILAMPLEEGERDLKPNIIRVGNNVTHSKNTPWFLEWYAKIRNFFPKNNSLVLKAKLFIWRHFIDQGLFYSKFFEKDLLHMSPLVFMAHDLPMLPLAVNAARYCNAYVVYDSHELYCEQDLSNREKNYWKNIERKYIGSCDVVITINASIAKILQTTYSLNTVHIIQNADRLSMNIKSNVGNFKNNTLEKDTIAVHLDTALQQKKTFHKAFKLTKDTKILLYQGNLFHGRNIENLIDAMHILNKRRLNRKKLSLPLQEGNWHHKVGLTEIPPIALVILGEGPLKLDLQKKVKKLGLLNNVLFHPLVPQNEVIELTSSADAGIIPYSATCLNNYYCTPNKLFEFIVAGIPILASDLPEIRKIVARYDLGLVGAMDKSLDIADIIIKFFTHKNFIGKWRTTVEYLRQKICWENEEKKLISAFEKFNMNYI